MVGLLKEMTAKFEGDPPLSSKATVENKDPHELLAFVSNLQINDGTSSDAQRRHGVSRGFNDGFISSLLFLRFSQTARQNPEQSVGHWGRGLGDGVSHEHSVKGNSPTLHLSTVGEFFINSLFLILLFFPLVFPVSS